METLGDVLREIRGGLKLHELAPTFCTTPAAISRYENNERQPNAKAMAHYFNVATPDQVSRILSILLDQGRDDRPRRAD